MTTDEGALRNSAGGGALERWRNGIVQQGRASGPASSSGCPSNTASSGSVDVLLLVLLLHENGVLREALEEHLLARRAIPQTHAGTDRPACVTLRACDTRSSADMRARI